MCSSGGKFLQDEAWLQLESDIDGFVHELVAPGDTQKLLDDLKERLVKLKLSHLKLRLLKLKYCLQQDLEWLEERLLVHSQDEEARRLVAIGCERLVDMWLRESLLERLTSSSEQQTALVNIMSRDLPDRYSREAV